MRRFIAGALSTVEHTPQPARCRRPLWTLRRTLRPRSSDGAARGTRAGLSRSPSRSGLSSRAGGSADQLRRPPDTAVLMPSVSAKYHGGAKIYIKREDLLHTGAHKINNCLGQALLARRMGKKRIIAETGAGQHGVATATVCALFGLECIVYMGEEDMRRQRLNVFRMRMLGAKVVGVAERQPDSEGRHQRSHARLGDQRPEHALPARLGAGRASLSDDGSRFSPRDRRGDTPPDPGARAAAAGFDLRLRRRRQQRHRNVPRVSRRRGREADRRGGGRPRR